MYNYVNEEAFVAWYEETTGRKPNKKALLQELSRQYIKSRKGEFVLPAGECLSGEAQCYSFSFENIGCCGASTIYFYL